MNSGPAACPQRRSDVFLRMCRLRATKGGGRAWRLPGWSLRGAGERRHPSHLVAGISIGASSTAPLIAGIHRRGASTAAALHGRASPTGWTGSIGNGERRCSAEVAEKPAVCGFALLLAHQDSSTPHAYPPPWLYPPVNANAQASTTTSRLRATLRTLSTSIVSMRQNHPPEQSRRQRRKRQFRRISIPKPTRKSAGAYHGRAAPCRLFSSHRDRSEHYWDGGLVSKHATQWCRKPASSRHPGLSKSIFRRRGEATRAASLAEVIDAPKGNSIFQPHPASTDSFQSNTAFARVTADLLESFFCPRQELRRSPEAAACSEVADRKVVQHVGNRIAQIAFAFFPPPVL